MCQLAWYFFSFSRRETGAPRPVFRCLSLPKRLDSEKKKKKKKEGAHRKNSLLSRSRGTRAAFNAHKRKRPPFFFFFSFPSSLQYMKREKRTPSMCMKCDFVEENRGPRRTMINWILLKKEETGTFLFKKRRRRHQLYWRVTSEKIDERSICHMRELEQKGRWQWAVPFRRRRSTWEGCHGVRDCLKSCKFCD